MPHNDAGGRSAKRAHGRDIGLLTGGERAGSDKAGQHRRLHDAERDHHILNVGPQEADDSDREQKRRKCEEGVHEPHQRRVEPPSDIARQNANWNAEREGKENNEQAD